MEARDDAGNIAGSDDCLAGWPKHKHEFKVALRLNICAGRLRDDWILLFPSGL